MTIRNVWWPGLGLGVGQKVAGGHKSAMTMMMTTMIIMMMMMAVMMITI